MMRGRAIAILVGATVICGCFAAGLATRPGAKVSNPPGGQVSIGEATLSYPSDWHLVTASRQLLGRPATGTAELRQVGDVSGAHLSVGAIDGVGAAGLPGLLARFETPERAQVVALQGLQAYHETGLRDSAGSTANLYVIPVAGRLLVVACVAPSSASPAFMPTCDGIAGHTFAFAARPDLDIRPDAAYAGRVNVAMSALNTTRVAARRVLRERGTSATQSLDADRVAAAYAAAAARVAAAGPPEPAGPVNAQVAQSLRAAGAAYASLATAARAHAPGAYAGAGVAITRAERRVAAALAGLRVLGYTVGGGGGTPAV